MTKSFSAMWNFCIALYYYPQQVLDVFMVRQDGFRVCIDDMYHNIGGVYLYWKNYDKLVSYEMMDGEDTEE